MSEGHPRLLGHRGSPEQRTENTMPSYQAALDAGLDGVELDVQRTLDGVLVIHHDFHLPDGRLIAALKAAEVGAVELRDGGRVPTLEEVLDWAEATGAYLNIEVKADRLATDGREAETIHMLQRHRFPPDQVVLSSFSPAAVARCRAADSRYPTGLLWDASLQPAWLLAGGQTAPVLGLAAIHPHHTLINAELMANARRHGWLVNTWTVNDEPEARRLLELGVNALIGNRPAVLLAAAGRVAA
ncbi:MAG TPA: glycerophosphodiester phosphodiesterase [Deinococcales bacterium]|nr:glycerophosphodiester phosphodiesterase [Deinococcales bacterium]